MSNDQTYNASKITFLPTEDKETGKDVLLEEVDIMREQIETLVDENRDLDYEIHLAEAKLKKYESIASNEQGLIQEENQLKEKLTALSEKVEVLLTATEEMEEADLLDQDNVEELTLKEEEKVDGEIKSLKTEIEEKQKTLANLRKQ